MAHNDAAMTTRRSTRVIYRPSGFRRDLDNRHREVAPGCDEELVDGVRRNIQNVAGAELVARAALDARSPQFVRRAGFPVDYGAADDDFAFAGAHRDEVRELLMNF